VKIHHNDWFFSIPDILGNFGFVEILSLFILLKKAMRVTPSLPQRGRQPKKEHPLDPFLYISPVSKESFLSTSRGPSYFL
jgi:hypothetical protein